MSSLKNSGQEIRFSRELLSAGNGEKTPIDWLLKLDFSYLMARFDSRVALSDRIICKGDGKVNYILRKKKSPVNSLQMTRPKMQCGALVDSRQAVADQMSSN